MCGRNARSAWHPVPLRSFRRLSSAADSSCLHCDHLAESSTSPRHSTPLASAADSRRQTLPGRPQSRRHDRSRSSGTSARPLRPGHSGTVLAGSMQAAPGISPARRVVTMRPAASARGAVLQYGPRHATVTSPQVAAAVTVRLCSLQCNVITRLTNILFFESLSWHGHSKPTPLRTRRRPWQSATGRSWRRRALAPRARHRRLARRRRRFPSLPRRSASALPVSP